MIISLFAMTLFAGERFSYVYSRGGGAHSTISRGSLQDILRLQKRYSGAYLWAMRDGQEYLTRDAAVLDEVRRAASDLDALEPDQRALHNRMRPLERKQELLEKELDALTDAEGDHDTARIRQLENELHGIERELNPYEREEGRLDRRESELDRLFDAEVERIVERAIRSGVAKRVR